MIPKTIHYCWFGQTEKPQSVIDCISTWRHMLPDYQIKEWNENNFDYKSLAYTFEAYKVKQYAYVSDVARMYALLTEGGIYLDTDVRVIKTFNPFLSNHSFASMESPFSIGTAVIGAEPGLCWMADYLNTYFHKHFIRYNGHLKTIPNTDSLSHFLDIRYPIDENYLTIYNQEYFSAKIFNTGEYLITENTIAIHDYSGSWINGKIKDHRVANLLVLLYSVLVKERHRTDIFSMTVHK